MPTLNKKQRKLPNQIKSNSNKSWSYHQIYHTKQWRNIRKLKLNINPLCQQCEQQGLTTEANVVDHINPVQEGGAAFDLDNLQSLCVSHHNSKTAKNRGKGGKIL